MLTRILVPLDGSALAERALTVAARLARTTDAALLVLQVYPGMIGETAPELVAYSETADARAARAYLDRVRQRPDLHDLAIEALALSGGAARAILDAVEAFQADTIVMSSHGRSGITRWALGSVAEHVVRHATVPVLVLRGAATGLAGDGAIEPAPAEGAWSVCIGLDGSELAEQVVAPAAQLLRALAGQAAAEALLVRIMKPPSPADDELAALAHETPAEYERRFVAAQDALHVVAERLRVGDLAHFRVHPRWSVIQATDVATALLQVAEHPDWVRWRAADTVTAAADGESESAVATSGSGAASTPVASASLIALATHGRGGVQRWALGSVAERILEGTALPLLLVRPTGTAAQASD